MIDPRVRIARMMALAESARMSLLATEPPKPFDRSKVPKSIAPTRQGAVPIPGARAAYRLGSIGVVPLRGVMFQGEDDLTELIAYCYGGTVTERFADDVRAAAADKQVESIILDIDSPGGDATGLTAAGDAVAAAARRKPTVACNRAMMCSAAYKVAVSAGVVLAAPDALSGSIGTYMGWLDYTEMLAKLGIKEQLFVSDSSPNKVPDANTDRGRMQYQTLVNAVGRQFVEHVAKHRNRTAQQVIDDFGGGDVLVSSEAIKVGMIDGISTFEQALAELRGDTRSGVTIGRAVAAKTAVPAPRVAALPGATAAPVILRGRLPRVSIPRTD